MTEGFQRRHATDHQSGWLIVRRDGNVVAAEHRACSLVGAPDPEALVGRDWTSLIAFEARGSLGEVRAAMERGVTWSGTVLYRYAHEAVTLGTVINPVPRAANLFVVSLEPAGQPALAAPYPPEATPTSPRGSAARTLGEALDDAATETPIEAARGSHRPPRSLASATPTARTASLSPSGDQPFPPNHPEVQVVIHEALRDLHDPGAASRAVLQSLATAVPFEWSAVLRISAGEVTVLATYPAPMAGIAAGVRWSPPGDAESALRRSGEPSLSGEVRTSEPRTPLDRLPAFGLRSRVLLPLYAGAGVVGAVALYRGGSNAFDAHAGVTAERLVRPLGDALGTRGARDVPAPATGPVEAAPEPAVRPPTAASRGIDPADHLSASRLESLGEMVAGVAHELNNPLTSILGYAQILGALDEAERAHAIQTIEDEAQRAARIVRNLLSFARQRPGERRPTDLESVLRRIVDLRRYSLEVDNIRVITRFGHVPEVRVDEGQFEQAFLNLLSNAHQALKEHGGEVVISTWVEGPAVYVSFADDGPGVPQEMRARVFEPFFTTREVGAGQGMGLSIVYGVVTNHGGRTWVEPSTSGGANFLIELPAGEEPLPSEDAATPEATQGARTTTEVATEVASTPRLALAGTGPILVVDDEPPVRALTQQILQAHGYTVETAESGAQALRMLERRDYSLVVTDLRMPGVSGVEMYHQIEERWPALANRVLFVTGDIEGGRGGQRLDRDRVNYLEKPFTTQQLLAAIDRILH